MELGGILGLIWLNLCDMKIAAFIGHIFKSDFNLQSNFQLVYDIAKTIFKYFRVCETFSVN